MKDAILSRHSLHNEEEKILFFEWKNGSEKALSQIIANNMPLIEKAADRYKDTQIQKEDLINQGVLGFIKAMNRYDPEKGFLLSAYALPSVISEIAEYVYHYITPVTVPRDRRMRSLVLNAKHETDQTKHSWLQKSDIEFLSNIKEGLEISMANFSDIIADDCLFARHSNPEIEFLENDNAKFKKELILKALFCLTKRERAVFKARYLREPAVPLEEIARFYRVTAPNIHKIEKKAYIKFVKNIKNMVRKNNQI